MTASDMVDAGVEVKPYLDELVGSHADSVRARLDDLLGSTLDEEELAERIRALLEQHEGTRRWLESRGRSTGAAAEPEAAPPVPAGQAAPPPAADAAPPAPPAPPRIAANGGDDDLLGGGPSDRNGRRPRKAHARIDAPGEVAVGAPFEVVVGLREDADPAVFGSTIPLPDEQTVVQAHITADGMELSRGGSWRQTLVVEPGEELPAVTLELTPEPQFEAVREARLQVLYSIEGQAVGFGSRSIIVSQPEVVAGRQPVPQPQGAAQFPVQAIPPDLTVEIRTGSLPGVLMWSFESPYGIGLPDAAIETSIGMHADAFAKTLIRQVDMREGEQDLFPFLRGMGRQIADRMPPQFFTLLRAAARAAGRTPMVQLLTEEPHVPWELAWIDPPLLDAEAPEFLAAQATVGRWTTGIARPPLPPPLSASVEAMAVITGRYDQVPGWKRLEAAEQEADELAQRYQATKVEAKLEPVMACLDGDPHADVLHFAVHGNYDQQGLVDGLVLVDRKFLNPTVVGGYTLSASPLVFLNACQVGTGGEVLGDYGGMAHAFLQAGASAVIAPLWSVKDTTAKDFALHFYEEVRGGARPAEVLRKQRGSVGPAFQTKSATPLAYQFFGHPAMAIGGSDG